LVENTLEHAKWHVVHYAGHTHYDVEKHKGYLFFPKGGAHPVEPISIGAFALKLTDAETRFVFLSSCKSAGYDSIYQLAKEGVPAIMGFRWEVDDDKAREFAESFYRNLFDGGHGALEYACLAAKMEMHANWECNAIWASVLVMQVSS
jgi:CHAT domain-containing protein